MKNLLSFDIKLQWRQGFWLVYMLVCIFYLAILFSIPVESRLFVSILLVLSDTSVLGIIFIGALLLLEKQQNVLQSLFVTPLPVNKYLWSKTISLGLISIVMSTILLIVPNGYDNWFWMRLFVVVTTSVMFTLIGIGMATRANTINQFFMNIIAGSMVIIIPVVPFLLWERFSWLVIFPLNAALEIMFSSGFDGNGPFLLLNCSLLLVWCGLALWFAKAELRKNILQKA